jgi:hypothetical protein
MGIFPVTRRINAGKKDNCRTEKKGGSDPATIGRHALEK